jgi:ribose/xylose/arabinose/galactoside ABC-type transport system permease subunit
MNGESEKKSSSPVPGKAAGLKKIFSLSGPFLGLAFIILLFGFLQPQKFLSAYNFMTVANQTVIVALAAMGMTFIIISGGIDLSVGSVIALNTVVTALLIQHGIDPFLALVAGVLSGVATGALSGLLIGGLGIVPFIATLGMMGIARGVAKWLAGEQKVDAPMTWLWQLMGNSDQLGWMLLPPGVWLMAIGSVAVAVLLRYSLFGRYTFAIGSNESTARLCGIRVERMKFLIYTFGGLMTGLAGVMQFSRLTVGDPTVAQGKELDVIAAVVIGGGSLSGGEGSILGTVIGAFIMSFLRNGCNMTGIPNYVQEIIIGLIIVGAVAADNFRQRKLK